MTDQEKAMQSAHFKRDYVTLSAVGLFLLTVVFQLVLAISIPLSFSNENLYAEQEARQRMLDQFDSLRALAKSPGPSDEAKAQKTLIEWDLNLLKNYLKNYSSSLGRAEISAIAEVLKAYQTEISYCQSDQAANLPLVLDLDAENARSAEELQKLADDIGKDFPQP